MPIKDERCPSDLLPLGGGKAITRFVTRYQTRSDGAIRQEGAWPSVKKKERVHRRNANSKFHKCVPYAPKFYALSLRSVSTMFFYRKPRIHESKLKNLQIFHLT